MKKIYCLLFVLFLITNICHAQFFDFVTYAGGNYNDKGQKILEIPGNGFIVVGVIGSLVDFDPGPNVFQQNCWSNDGNFIAKYDNSGQIEWTTRLNDDSLTLFGMNPSTIAFRYSAASGNFYISQSGTNNRYIGLYKFSISGYMHWKKVINTNSSLQYITLNDLVLDTQENLYITGALYGQANLDFINHTNFPMGSSGSYEPFLIKTDSSAATIWQDRFNTISNSNPNTVLAILNDTTIYLSTAAYGGSCTSRQFYKLDSAGTKLWNRYFLMDANEQHKIALDKDCNIFIAGVGGYNSSNDFDPSTAQHLPLLYTHNGTTPTFYLAAYDSSLNFKWVSMMGTEAISGTMTALNALAIDSTNQIYIGGKCGANLYFPNGDTLFTDNNNEIFFSKFDAIGNNLQNYWIGSSQDDEVFDISIASNNRVYFCGEYSDSIDMDPGPNSLYLRSFNNLFTDYWAGYATWTINSVPVLLQDEISVTVWPNPFNDEVSVSYSKSVPHSVKLFTMEGRLIYTASSTNSTDRLNISGLSSGIYILRVDSDKGEVIQKLIRN